MIGFYCFGVLGDQGAPERLVWSGWIEAWLKRLLFGLLAMMKVAFLCFGRNQKPENKTKCMEIPVKKRQKTAPLGAGRGEGREA